jgi:hypothetical protein
MLQENRRRGTPVKKEYPLSFLKTRKMEEKDS